MVPGHLVPHNWSPIDWSLWTNGPQPIQSPWTNGPQKFGPHGQMVPNQFGPPGQMVPSIFRLSRGTGCGDLEIRGPNWLGKSRDQISSRPNALQPIKANFIQNKMNMI